jgi:hypothetical protein
VPQTVAAPAAEPEPTTIEASAPVPDVAPATEERPDRFTGLDALVAGANHDAASSSNSQIPRPTASQPTAAEEPPLMERVQEQTRPTRLETPSPAPSPAPAPAAPASDLASVLAAERARLLDQRELLEARFRNDVEAIDERLLHVESLLSDERVALAS